MINQYITKKRIVLCVSIILLIIFIILIQLWRIKGIDHEIKNLSTDSRCYQNNYLISDRGEEYQPRVRKWLKNRKVFVCDGWHGFRTAIFIADENNNLIYYYRDTSLIFNDSHAMDFVNSEITEDKVRWRGVGDGWSAADDKEAGAPLYPSTLQRIDAKIIQKMVEWFY
ncbi:hypothetical protein [Wielerella bovis]|uniref:hypothetical protein n=1 Tax=Wielerella bovis TaxID=2917790 RepID=UPI002018D5DB|nr:hypothetical protein [Wielerella bovis]ULJ60074.1 hypothetical protein MIS44_10505 [Wielerella bovis]